MNTQDYTSYQLFLDCLPLLLISIFFLGLIGYGILFPKEFEQVENKIGGELKEIEQNTLL